MSKPFLPLNSGPATGHIVWNNALHSVTPPTSSRLHRLWTRHSISQIVSESVRRGGPGRREEGDKGGEVNGDGGRALER